MNPRRRRHHRRHRRSRGGLTQNQMLLLGGAALLFLTPIGAQLFSRVSGVGQTPPIAGLGRVTGGGIVSNPAGWAPGTSTARNVWSGTRALGPGLGAFDRLGRRWG